MYSISKSGFDHVESVAKWKEELEKYNVSLFTCGSNSKEFSSDEKELNFCTTMTTLFWFVSYYWCYSYLAHVW